VDLFDKIKEVVFPNIFRVCLSASDLKSLLSFIIWAGLMHLQMMKDSKDLKSEALKAAEILLIQI
jgi:hypothetical protein